MTNESVHFEPIDKESFDEVVKQLQDKIKSKMDVAKFFAGFISLVFGIVLKDFIGTQFPASSDSESKIALVGFTFSENQIALWGFTLLLISLAGSVATLFAYDRLLMPPKLWSIKPYNYGKYDYTKDLENLKEDMIFAWKWYFRPTVAALFGGLICLLVVVTEVSDLWIVGFILACLVPFIFYLLFTRSRILSLKNNLRRFFKV